MYGGDAHRMNINLHILHYCCTLSIINIQVVSWGPVRTILKPYSGTGTWQLRDLLPLPTEGRSSRKPYSMNTLYTLGAPKQTQITFSRTLQIDKSIVVSCYSLSEQILPLVYYLFTNC